MNEELRRAGQEALPMEGLDKHNQLPREVQIMYERLPKELRHELDALPSDKIVSVLEGLNKLHRTMEAEVYELALRLVQAAH
ncbi:MAG: hypothetical protein KAW90_02910 [Dehalococcoidales bacterium]|nr:hypothetical protein [Dehalococcoidales bacterium]